jgi:mono/diheme cytochrome c family protein
MEPPLPADEVEMLLGFIRFLSPGYALYDRYCAACHGDDGRGSGDLGDGVARPAVVFDRDYFRRRDPEEVRRAAWHMLAKERPAMPHLRRAISERGARAVIEYLKAMD